MNTFRTLPLLRPSRSSTPAARTPENAVEAPVGMMGPPAVPGLPTRSRSVSRPLGINLTLGAHSHTPNGNGTAHKPSGHSPPGSRPATPRSTPQASLPGTVPLPTSGLAAGAEPQGGFIDAIGLKLNEQVNKTCLGVDFKTKKSVKKGSGWQLGEVVVREFPPHDADAYLLRAVLRTAIRSLSIYVSRLEYLVLPALTDAAFSAPLNLATPTPTSQQLNPAQLFALSLCHAAWETCEVLELTLDGKPTYPRFVHELLRPVMDKLDSVVARVVTPLMGNLKRELLVALDLSGHSPLGNGKGLPLPGTPTNTAVVNAKVVNNTPLCLKAFASRIEAARRVFEIVCKDCRDDGESWVTSVVVAVVWKGMVSCQTRYALQGNVPSKDQNGRPPSPESMARALAALAVEPARPLPVALAGPVSAVGKMASILPSRPSSRPPSPPRKSGESGRGGAMPVDPTAHFLATFEALVQRLVTGLVLPPAKSPSDPNATENLAREALGEAIEALQSQRYVVTALQSGPNTVCDILKALRDNVEMPTQQEEMILDAAEDVPAILLFHLLARRVNIAVAKYITSSDANSSATAFLRSPYEVWGLSSEEYDRQVMSGFGVAEERARRVALAWKGEVERVLPEVNKFNASASSISEIKGWLRSLGLALEARTGVKVTVSL